MNCINCGSTIPDTSIYCPYCGASAITGEANPEGSSPIQVQDISQAAPAPQDRQCPHCGGALLENMKFCGFCGSRLEDAPPPPAEEAQAAPPKKKRKRLPIVLSVIASVLVVAIIAGLLTNWFGFYGPGAKIISAFKNTFEEGNLSITFTVNGDASDQITCKLDIDQQRNDLSLVLIKGEDELICAIREGYLIARNISWTGQNSYTAYNISTYLDAFFESSSDGISASMVEKLLKGISPALYEDVCKFVDFDKLDGCLLKLYRKLNSDSWLKKNAGYSQTKANGATVYSFDPDTYDLAHATLECFKKVFRDEGDYDSLQDALSHSKDSLQELDYTVEFEVKDKKLTALGLQVPNHFELDIRFDCIGSTSIDTASLDALLDKAAYEELSFMALINILSAL